MHSFVTSELCRRDPDADGRARFTQRPVSELYLFSHWRTVLRQWLERELPAQSGHLAGQWEFVDV
jgi:hypothetical protein